MSRPLTRLRIVLGGAPAATVGHAAEAVAAHIADALAVHGVQVRQQLRGALPDGAPRADVALWLPDVPEGRHLAPDPRLAPARVHAALVVQPPDGNGGKALARFDGLLVPLAELRDPVRQALRRSSSREVPVIVARLPGAPLVSRESDKALHGVAGRRVVLVDVRHADEDGEAGLERIVVQLALKGHEGAVVLLTAHDERARARVRALCERHAVDAFLASGCDALAQSIAACDLLVGRPSWDELLLAALYKVTVCALAVHGKQSLVDALRITRARGGTAHAALIDDIPSMLQLAAALDRRLGDAGSLDTRGIALREALFGADAELIDALKSLEPLPHGAAAAAAWEAIGPHAADTLRDGGVVNARDKTAALPGASPSRAQKIEDALEALKQKMGT